MGQHEQLLFLNHRDSKGPRVCAEGVQVRAKVPGHFEGNPLEFLGFAFCPWSPLRGGADEWVLFRPMKTDIL